MKKSRIKRGFILCIGLLLAGTLQLNAQKVSFPSETLSLEKALEKIESVSKYKIAYNESKIDVSRKVTLNYKNKEVLEIVSELLKGTGFAYKLKGEYIIITPVEDKNTQKKKTISGVVKDQNGEPVIGATIVEKGADSGVITNLDGRYSFAVAENAKLIVTYIGYKPQEIQAGVASQEIVLQEDTQVLDEVVVVGYGVQKKVNLSGSVSTVNTKALNDRPVINIGQALQGAVANMSVTLGSGNADDSPSYNIRGTTSLNGGSPLVVIDGIVSNKDLLNRMNPTDIENISVLKDAASSAIYGSRAAYGVILVTTKTGKDDKLTVNYNNNFVIRTLTPMPEVITDPYDIATIRNVMGKPFYNFYTEEQLAYAKRRSEDPSVSPYYVNPDGTYSYFGDTDWIGETYKETGFSTSHAIDLSGRTKRLNYYFSGNYNFQDGMLNYGNDKYNRYNLRAKLDFKIADWWKIGSNISFITSDYDYSRYMSTAYREVNRLSPLDMPKNPDGTWTDKGGSRLGRLQDGGRTKKLQTDMNVQFSTKIDVIKNLFSINANFSYSLKKTKSNGYSLPVTYYTGPDMLPKYHDAVSDASGYNTDVKHILYDIYGAFGKTFAEKHSISATVGFNQEEYRTDKMSMSRADLISSSLPTVNLATGKMSMSQGIETWALRGAFARFNYTFADKYIVEFNGRYDGTSRFPKDDRFVFNPSGSLAWVVSKEKFFEPLTSVVSFLKFRGSYGTLGNQDVGAYAYLASMSSGTSSYILDGKQPVYVSAPGLVSGSLTWEKVTTGNFGVDVNFLNNRLTVSGDVYRRDTKDMLTKGATLPLVLGAKMPQENAADLKTRGWDVTIGWKDQVQVAGKPFRYNASFNLGDSRSFITKFANEDGRLGENYVGKELGEIWGLNTLGFFTSEEDIKNHADQTETTTHSGTRPLAPGDLKFEDLNRDGKINDGDWTLDNHGDYRVIGNTKARYTFGLSLGGEWNGFDLSLLAQGVGKKDYMPGTGDLFFWGIYAQPWTNVMKGNFEDHWSEENPNGYYPRFKSYVAEVSGEECGASQTRYLQNAAYVRLKNLTVGYTLPQLLTSRVGINRLRVFFSGDNLFEITGLYKYYKVDPEGLRGEIYPFQRSFSFGLNVSF